MLRNVYLLNIYTIAYISQHFDILMSHVQININTNYYVEVYDYIVDTVVYNLIINATLT